MNRKKVVTVLMSTLVAIWAVNPLSAVCGQSDNNLDLAVTRNQEAAGTGIPIADVEQKSNSAEAAEGRILVKFKKSAQSPGISNTEFSESGGTSKPGNSVAVMDGTVELSPTASTKLKRLGVSVEKTFSKVGWSRATTKGDIHKTIEALLRSGLVEYAEPAYKLTAEEVSNTANKPYSDLARKVQAKDFPRDPPNDPLYSSLWGLNQSSDVDIDAPEGWKIKSDASNVIVGVIDTGVNYKHEDLAANMWRNPKEIPGNGVDDDGNGYIDDVYGIDTRNHDSDPMDDSTTYGTGTIVAGTVGAVGNNGKGVIGVAPTVNIMAIKGFGKYRESDVDNIVEAINYALAIKAANAGDPKYQRMVLQVGGAYFGSVALRDAIRAAQGANVLVVAPTGSWHGTSSYPADYDFSNVVSVGGFDQSDHVAYLSNYGCEGVDLLAPSSASSTFSGNQYMLSQSTDVAAAYVSGASALVWSKASTPVSWSQVKAAIMNGVEQKVTYREKAVAQGRLNLQSALSGSLTNPAVFAVVPSSISPSSPVVISGANFGSSAGTVTLNGNAFNISSWTDTEITATAPASPSYGIGSLQVTTSLGNSSVAGGCARLAAPSMGLVGHTIFPRIGAADAQVGNAVWVIGGDSFMWSVTGLVERVQLGAKPKSTTDTDWMIPTGIRYAGAAAIGNKIYVVGGLDANWNSIDKLQIFDTATKTWSEGAHLPMKLFQPAVTASGNKLIVFGGMDKTPQGSALNETLVYTPSTNKWAKKAPMPTPRAFAKAMSLGIPNQMLVIGGFPKGGVNTNPIAFGAETYELPTVEQYDLATNTWKAMPPLLYARAGFAGGYVGKPIVAGGLSSKTGETYTADQWRDVLSLPEGLFTPASGVYGNSFYMINGGNSVNNLLSNRIYRYEP